MPIEYYLYKAYGHEQNGQYAEAFLDYKKASGIQPGNYKLHNKLASILIHLSSYDEAEASLIKVLELNGAYVPGLINMGIVSAKKRRYGEAERYLSAALSRDRTHMDALYNMVIVYRKAGKYRMASEYSRKLKALGFTPGKNSLP